MLEYLCPDPLVVDYHGLRFHLSRGTLTVTRGDQLLSTFTQIVTFFPRERSSVLIVTRNKEVQSISYGAGRMCSWPPVGVELQPIKILDYEYGFGFWKDELTFLGVDGAVHKW